MHRVMTKSPKFTAFDSHLSRGVEELSDDNGNEDNDNNEQESGSKSGEENIKFQYMQNFL